MVRLQPWILREDDLVPSLEIHQIVKSNPEWRDLYDEIVR